MNCPVLFVPGSEPPAVFDMETAFVFVHGDVFHFDVIDIDIPADGLDDHVDLFCAALDLHENRAVGFVLYPSRRANRIGGLICPPAEPDSLDISFEAYTSSYFHRVSNQCAYINTPASMAKVIRSPDRYGTK